MKIAVFIDGQVGFDIAKVFHKNSKQIEILVINQNAADDYKKKIQQLIKYEKIFTYDEFLKYVSHLKDVKLFDLGILCWWPFIIKRNVLNSASLGFLNFHPSLLPYGRGKHPNFWTLVDDTAFGVTLHWVDESIDGGDIAFQKEIKRSWLDNGETLYKKSIKEIVNLFENHFQQIISGNIPRVPQVENLIVRFSKEIDDVSCIDLKKKYLAGKLVNLLRARTFLGFPSCWFEDDGKKYEIKVEIKEV